MAKQSTKGTTKAPRGKTAAAAPVEQPGLVGEAEPMLETPEATVPAAEELPPAVPGEAAAVPPEAPESGLETGAVPEGDSLPEDQAVPEGDSKPEGRRAVVRSPKGLNLRAGPALNYDVLEVLPDGMEVLALDLPRGAAVPGWELVDAGGRTGWASARFLRPLED